VLKKAGVVAAAAAGLLMLAGPAFAGGEGGHSHGYGHGYGHAYGDNHGYGDDHGYGDNSSDNDQIGLLNLNDIDVAKDIDLNAVLGVCGNNVGVLGAAVPILSPQITGTCAAGGIMDDD
jgi:hypothetical protein